MSKETQSIIKDPSNKENSRGQEDRSVGKELASQEERLEFNLQQLIPGTHWPPSMA